MNQTLLFSKSLYFIGQMIEIINEKNTLLSLAKRSNVSIYELISLLNPSIKRTIIQKSYSRYVFDEIRKFLVGFS